MTSRFMLAAGLAAGLAVGLAFIAMVTQAQAETKQQALTVQANFTPEQAVKGQAWLDAAMMTPMLDLLSHADVTNPQGMMEYGLALELGRPSASAQLPQSQKDKLKEGYRSMLDLYLNASDKKDPVLSKVDFTEDAMLDNQEFWVDLAKQIGHRKERTAIDQSVPAQGPEDPGAPMMTFIADPQNNDNGLNLNQDLVLQRGIVNAATACAESAAGFAKMRKTQLIDIAATRLSPDAFAKAKAEAVRTYRIAYAEGIQACGSEDYFMKAAKFAGQHLGALGEMKEDPNAKLADLKVKADDAKTQGDDSLN